MGQQEDIWWQRFMDIIKVVGVIIAGALGWLQLAQLTEQQRFDTMFRAVDMRSTPDGQNFLKSMHEVVLDMIGLPGSVKDNSCTQNGMGFSLVLCHNRPELREVVDFYTTIYGLGQTDNCLKYILHSDFSLDASQFYIVFNPVKDKFNSILCVGSGCSDVTPQTLFTEVYSIAYDDSVKSDSCTPRGLGGILSQAF